jgi:hypothetical protein
MWLGEKRENGNNVQCWGKSLFRHHLMFLPVLLYWNLRILVVMGRSLRLFVVFCHFWSLIARKKIEIYQKMLNSSGLVKWQVILYGIKQEKNMGKTRVDITFLNVSLGLQIEFMDLILEPVAEQLAGAHGGRIVSRIM